MNEAQLAQLKAMSQSERLGYYFKKLVAGEITKEIYDKAIKFCATLPYQSPYEEGTVVGWSDGESPEAVEPNGGVDVEHGDEGRDAIEPPPRKDAHGTSVECTREDFVSGLAHGGISDVPRPDVGNVAHSTSQKERLFSLLQDGNWHDTPEIQVKVYGRNHLGVARIGARIKDLRDDGYTIETNRVTQAIWEYRLIDAKISQVAANFSSG